MRDPDTLAALSRLAITERWDRHLRDIDAAQGAKRGNCQGAKLQGRFISML